MHFDNTGKIQLKPEQKVHWVPLGLIFQHSGQFERELGDWKTAQSVAKCPLHKLDDLSSVSSTNGGSVLIPVTGVWDRYIASTHWSVCTASSVWSQRDDRAEGSWESHSRLTSHKKSLRARKNTLGAGVGFGAGVGWECGMG